MRRAALIVLALAATAGEAAGPPGKVWGTVTVVADGVTRSDARGVIVYLVGFSEPPPRGRKIPEIVQRNRRFEPDLLAITAGQEVAFPNADPFFHNVFSLSPGARFDLGQYRRGESKTKLFVDTGPAEIYCNIHPEMAATVLVLPNQRFAATGVDGSYQIDGVPPGTWRIYAYDRRASAPVSAEVTVTPGGQSRIDFSVVETRKAFPHKNKYGEEYRDPDRYR